MLVGVMTLGQKQPKVVAKGHNLGEGAKAQTLPGGPLVSMID